jgi:hypothetical protein
VTVFRSCIEGGSKKTASVLTVFFVAAAGLSDSRNPLKALQRLRQDPDSTEFVYLRPFRVDETMPINPYHLEIVSHADIDEVSSMQMCSAA